MAVYLVDDIVRDVRIALDRNMESAPLADIGDVDTLALDEIVRSKVVEAVRTVHSDAPVHLLDGGHNFGDAVYWKEKECGWILLPEDFMRLVVFRMSDWERPVYEAKEPEGPDWERQSSRFKGIRGTAQKPECFITFRPEGRALEFYSCKSEDATVTKGVYLPYPSVDGQDGIEVCSKCRRAVDYTAASLVLSTLGDNEKAAVFAELAKNAMV